MTVRLAAALALVLGLLPATATAAPVEPTHGGVYMVGTEFTAPCVNMKYPWNDPAAQRVAELTVHAEVDEYTVLIYDKGGDGFDYEFNPTTDDDMIAYIGSPQQDSNYTGWGDAYDTADCYTRAVTWGVRPAMPLPSHDFQSNDDFTGPGGQDPAVVGNPRPSHPVIADRDPMNVVSGAMYGVDTAVGQWRWERWRQTRPWYWDRHGSDCPDPPVLTDYRCWYNQNPNDLEAPVQEQELIERRQFTVSEPAVFITGGPSGKVGAPAATFEFVWVADEQDPGRYECSLDGAAWETCTSPKTYEGLEDGPHKFEVRYVLDGQNADEAHVTSRQWVVDTTPPGTIIQSAPAGTVEGSAVTIEFISTEPDTASYECRLDGGPIYECSSPERLTGLAPGAHLFEVRSYDRVGNRQTGWTPVAWTNSDLPPSSAGSGGGGDGPRPAAGGGTSTPPPPASTGCEHGKVEASQFVAVARNGGCFKQTKPAKDTTRYSTRGAITVNGVQLTPGPLTDIVLTVTDESITFETNGPAAFELGPWKIPLQKGFKQALDRQKGETITYKIPALSSGTKALTKLAGRPLAAEPVVELAADKGGSSKIKVAIEAPGVIRAVKGAPPPSKEDGEDAGSVSGEFGASASNEEGVKLGGKLVISKAFLFGKAAIEDLTLGLDYPPLSFEGGFTVVFASPGGTPAGEKREPKFTVSTAWANEFTGAFAGVTKLSLQASNFQKPIGHGFYLQRFGAEAARCTEKTGGFSGQFSANAGVSFGPKLSFKPLFEGEAISLDGKASLNLCDPVTLEASGDGKIVEVPVAKLEFKNVIGESVRFKGLIDWSIPYVLGYKGGIVDAWATADGFNVESTARLSVGPFAGESNGVISSTGFAACYGSPGTKIGVTKRWGGAWNKFMTGGCDVGPLRVAASKSQAGAPQPFEVPAGSGVHVLVARGETGPPQLVLDGPSGATVATPDGSTPLDSAAALIVKVAEEKTTYVALRNPAAGQWTATSGTPFTMQTAPGLPPVKIAGKVTGTGANRVLSWRGAARRGQTIEFFERGAETARKLGSTTRGRGTLRFRPANARARARAIEAVVTQDGIPRATVEVARFQAPPFLRPARVAGLELAAGKVAWRRQRGASGYSVALRLPDGTTRVIETSKTSVPFKGKRVRVAITALGSNGTTGPLTAKTLKAPPKSKRRR